MKKQAIFHSTVVKLCIFNSISTSYLYDRVIMGYAYM